MAGLKDLSNIWKNIKEIDLKPIRDAATQPVKIALVGGQGAGRHSLAEQMRTDPARPGMHTQSPLAILPLDENLLAPQVHLVIILVDATSQDFSKEQAVAKLWHEAGVNLLIFINKLDLVEDKLSLDTSLGWQSNRVVYGSANDITFLQKEFVQAVLELLPQHHLALGRQFPLFRLPIARQLINDTCFSNAAYSFSTGLAEIVPVLDLPLNVTDMIVLTKSQAFLAYRLGLLVGFSTRWQDYVTEFGSVIGGGFIWRQIARQLVGLIPAWGIIPKVAVAYSGTYVVGNAILSWYLTGKNLSPKQLRALSIQSFARGKELARRLTEKFPKPRLGRRKLSRLSSGQVQAEIAPGEIIITTANTPAGQETGDAQSGAGAGEKKHIFGRRTKKKDDRKLHKETPQQLLGNTQVDAQKSAVRLCPQCGKSSATDASFCQYCGYHFDNQSGHQPV